MVSDYRWVTQNGSKWITTASSNNDWSYKTADSLNLLERSYINDWLYEEESKWDAKENNL